MKSAYTELVYCFTIVLVVWKNWAEFMLCCPKFSTYMNHPQRLSVRKEHYVLKNRICHFLKTESNMTKHRKSYDSNMQFFSYASKNAESQTIIFIYERFTIIGYKIISQLVELANVVFRICSNTHSIYGFKITL